MTDFDAVCGRGGLLRHIPSGTYAVSDQAIADVLDPPYGEHASNLGVLLARELGDMAGIPSFFVDPVCVDEMTPVAHVTGFKGMQRRASSMPSTRNPSPGKRRSFWGRPMRRRGSL